MEECIELDEKTQGVLKAIVDGTNQQVKQLQAQMQERVGLVVTGYINAKGGEGNYQVSKDFTTLEKMINENVK